MQHVNSVIVKLWSVTSKVVTSSLEGITEGLTIISDVVGKLLFLILSFCVYERDIICFLVLPKAYKLFSLICRLFRTSPKSLTFTRLFPNLHTTFWKLTASVLRL